jgi:phytoene dehydrogenase-like protein
VSELPRYTSYPRADGPQHRALQLLAPDLQYLRKAHQEYAAGRFSKNPALVSMTFSAVDSTLAPQNKHTLYLWGQYFPYELAQGANWNEVREAAAEVMMNTLIQYAPNMHHAIIDRYIETPLDIEKLFGMPRANITHLPASPAYMFFMRPAPSLSRYHGPYTGLYLSGASTHPGGGIFGLPGRITAQIVLKDLSREL